MRNILIALNIFLTSFSAFGGPFLNSSAFTLLEEVLVEKEVISIKSNFYSSPLKSVKIIKSVESENLYTGETSLEGTLQFGIFAIGGETTGVRILTENGEFEVDFSGYGELAALESLNGKRVELYGEFDIRHHVERGFQKIFIVEDLLDLE